MVLYKNRRVYNGTNQSSMSNQMEQQDKSKKNGEEEKTKPKCSMLVYFFLIIFMELQNYKQHNMTRNANNDHSLQTNINML